MKSLQLSKINAERMTWNCYSEKVKTRSYSFGGESIVYTESFSVDKIKNTWISCLITSSVNWRLVYYQRIWKGEIFSQIVGVSKPCDQNGDKRLWEWQKLLYLDYRTKRFLVKHDIIRLCLFMSHICSVPKLVKKIGLVFAVFGLSSPHWY